MKIFHCTTLENLALILRHRTIRFNSAHLVDDPQEAETVDLGSFKDHLFLSCWTASEEENLALWSMYAKQMTGVRIESDSKYFDQIPGDEIQMPPVLRSGFRSANPNTAPMKWLVHDPLTDNGLHFYGRVEYTDNDKRFIQSQDSTQTTYEMESLFLKKSIHWAFQKELRFMLFACDLSGTGSNLQQIGNQIIINSIRDKKPLKCDYIDLEMPDSFFDTLRFRLGPKASNSDRILLESLIQATIPNNLNPIETSVIPIRQGASHA